MSKKDYQKGMADAMEAYEAFGQKQEAAIRNIEEKVTQAGEKVGKLGDKIGEISDYITEQEKAALYKLNTPVDIADLEKAEKRILLAVLYQLSADESEVTEEQQNYIRAVQQYLQIYNPQTTIGLEVVENIEDISAQKAVLQSVLEFFYLGTHPGTYTDDQMEFLDCFQINRKTRKEIITCIKSIIEVVGTRGLAEKYGVVASQPHSAFAKYKDNGRIPEAVADLCIAQLKQKEKSEYNEYDNRYGCVNTRYFHNHCPFLELQDYLLFYRDRHESYYKGEEHIDDEMGLFRINKLTGAIERLNLDYKNDMPFDIDRANFHIQGNTIYFAGNYSSVSRIVAVDVKEKACRRLPIQLTADANEWEEIKNVHLSGNESYLLIHGTVRKRGKYVSTKTYVVDLTQNFRTFILDSGLEEVYDAFIWNNKFLFWGEKFNGTKEIRRIGGHALIERDVTESLFEYNVEKQTLTNLLVANSDYEEFIIHAALKGNEIGNANEISIERMDFIGGRYYFLIYNIEKREYTYSVLNPENINESLGYLWSVILRNYRAQVFSHEQCVFFTDKFVFNFCGNEKAVFSYETLKVEYLKDVGTYGLILGDYFYLGSRYGCKNWKKANISDGIERLQWEILSL